MAGIFDYDPQAAKVNAGYKGLMDLGAALMAAGAPRTTPNGGLAAALGQGIGAFGTGYQNQLGQNQAAALNAYKMEELKRQAEQRAAQEEMFKRMTGQAVSVAPMANGQGPTVANAQAAQAMAPKLPAGLTPELAAAMGPEAFFKFAAEQAKTENDYGLKAKYEPMIAGATEAAKTPYLLQRKAGESEIEYANRIRLESDLNPIMASRSASAANAAETAKIRAMLSPVTVNGVQMPAGAAQPYLAQFGKVSADASPVNVGGATVPASQAEATAKKQAGAKNILGVLDEIEPLNPDGTPDLKNSILEQATGSGIGAMSDWTMRQFGATSPSAQAAAKLEALAPAVMLAMPRMEGPQSDRDVKLYEAAAGKLGDRTVPASEKRAAMDTIRKIYSKYAAPAQDGWSITPR